MKISVYGAAALLLVSCAGRGGNNAHDDNGHGHPHGAYMPAENHSTKECDGQEYPHGAYMSAENHSTKECDGQEHPHGSHSHHQGECSHDFSGHDREYGGCHEHSGAHDHVHGSAQEPCGGPYAGQYRHSDDPEDIVFTRAQARLAGVGVEVIERGKFCEVLKVTGVISPARGDEVNIVAPASGIISLGGNRFTEGSRVAAGAVLFRVSSDRVSGGDELALNRAAYIKAEADYERAQRLRGENIVSQAELDAARAAYESALAAYRSLNDGGTGEGAVVTTPIGGYIHGIAVTGGDYVETGRLLATVVRDRDMELYAEVPQRLYGRLAGVTDANFRPQGYDTVYSVSGIGGRLISKGAGVSPGTPFIPVVFRFGYVGGIPSGSYADVNLLGTVREGVLTVPVGAITEQQGLRYVYVRTGAEVYRRRRVTTGGNDGRRVEITGGLGEGDTVVVTGAVNLRVAAASGAIPHGHEH